MAWIESHQSLARHIKTKRFARKLRVTVPTAVGHLHLLWWWAMDNLPDGNLSVVEPEDIADEMMWEGDANELIDALVAAGFVDQTADGMFIHDWQDYIGRLLEKRRQDTERKRRNRMKAKGMDKEDTQESNESSDGCPAGHDEDVPEDGARNSTVPNQNKLKDSRPKRVYDADDVYYKMAEYLYEQIQTVNPNTKKPDMQKWADHARKMIEIDKRDINEVREVLRYMYSPRDTFWRTVVLSTDKLREQYDAINTKRLQGGQGGQVAQFKKRQIAVGYESELKG